MSRIRRVPIDGRPVFLTLVTHERLPVLRADAMKTLVLQALHSVQRRHPFRHIANAILDDHLHLLLQPEPATRIEIVVATMKRWVTFGSRELGLGVATLWQRRFHDHVIRDERDLYRHMDYIHFNPVKHGYCDAAADYRWSSFPAWCERGVYTAQWGRAEPQTTFGMNPE